MGGRLQPEALYRRSPRRLPTFPVSLPPVCPREAGFPPRAGESVKERGDGGAEPLPPRGTLGGAGWGPLCLCQETISPGDPLGQGSEGEAPSVWAEVGTLARVWSLGRHPSPTWSLQGLLPGIPVPTEASLQQDTRGVRNGTLSAYRCRRPEQLAETKLQHGLGTLPGFQTGPATDVPGTAGIPDPLREPLRTQMSGCPSRVILRCLSPGDPVRLFHLGFSGRDL